MCICVYIYLCSPPFARPHLQRVTPTPTHPMSPLFQLPHQSPTHPTRTHPYKEGPQIINRYLPRIGSMVGGLWIVGLLLVNYFLLLLFPVPAAACNPLPPPEMNTL